MYRARGLVFTRWLRTLSRSVSLFFDLPTKPSTLRDYPRSPKRTLTLRSKEWWVNRSLCPTKVGHNIHRPLYFQPVPLVLGRTRTRPFVPNPHPPITDQTMVRIPNDLSRQRRSLSTLSLDPTLDGTSPSEVPWDPKCAWDDTHGFPWIEVRSTVT